MADEQTPPEKGEERRARSVRAVRYVQIARQFQALGIASFDADLPNGQIAWLDADGARVAHGRCAAILSFEPGNDSMMWARGIQAFKDAGVPCVDPPEGMEDYREGVTAEEAEHLANEAAGREGADFYYEAPSGHGGALFLAIFEFVQEEQA